MWDTDAFVTLRLWVLCSEKGKNKVKNTKMCKYLPYIGVHTSQPCWSISKLSCNSQCCEGDYKLHKVPVEEWFTKGMDVKFVGDNVDKKVGVRDLRSDRRGDVVHMYSMLVVKCRVPSTGLAITSCMGDLTSCSSSPKKDELQAIRGNLVILVSRVLCKYMKGLKPLSSAVPNHILHKYSKEMALKYDVHVVDVLMKNEASHSGMVEIMQQSFVNESFPEGHYILSGGDHLTCERQVAAKRHLLDGDTRGERLELLEPQVEDWHTLMTFLLVSKTCLLLIIVIKNST